jgi:hypothetical protein
VVMVHGIGYLWTIPSPKINIFSMSVYQLTLH